MEGHESHLSEFAARSHDPQRAARREYVQEPDDFRTEFQRDYTRIIHSRPFRRLRNKTQVFIHPENDHICTRLEHSLHVASVARTIGRALELNLDLIEAIAVGHDVGHAPFGHKGEEELDKLGTDHGLTYRHETQSLRVVDLIESPYRERHPGLNLTFAVRDGIVMHCGEDYAQPALCADIGRSTLRNGSDGRTCFPATLEGCVVRWADRVAYLGRDFEDAVVAGIVRREELPAEVRRSLGTENRQFIAALVRDLVRNTQGSCVAVSPEVANAVKRFQEFSTDKIYRSPIVTKCFAQVQVSLQAMFEHLLKTVAERRSQWIAEDPPASTDSQEPKVMRVLWEFVRRDLPSDYEGSDAQLVLDFIGGMTDSFFIQSFRELFLPHSTA
jgi:dGTPase